MKRKGREAARNALKTPHSSFPSFFPISLKYYFVTFTLIKNKKRKR
jgi:hypothetical protein